MLTTLEHMMMGLVVLLVAAVCIQGSIQDIRESKSTESYKEILAYNLKPELDKCVLGKEGKGKGETLYRCTTKVVDKYKADTYAKNLEVVKKEIMQHGQQ